MNTEYSDLQAAQQAAKGIGDGAKTLLGLAYSKVKATVVDLHSQIRSPLSLEERALRTVEAKENQKVRGAKIRQVSLGLGRRCIHNLGSLAYNGVIGFLEGTVGRIDKTTKVLAERARERGLEDTPREAGEQVNEDKPKGKSEDK